MLNKKSAVDAAVASTGENIAKNANVRQGVVITLAVLGGVAGAVLLNKIRAKKAADETVEA